MSSRLLSRNLMLAERWLNLLLRHMGCLVPEKAELVYVRKILAPTSPTDQCCKDR